MSTQQRIRVVIVDDHHMVREDLKVLLSTAPDLDVVDEAADGDEAVRLVSRVEPDVVPMDIAMPAMNGAEATSRIKTAFPSIQVIPLTNYADGELVEQRLAQRGANRPNARGATERTQR